MQSAEFVVIGSGIIGSATTYYLARAGADVILVDRAGPNAGGTASQACAGGVRQQGRAPEEIPLAIYAIGLWDGLEAELEADLHYRRDGMTVSTDDENLISVLQKRVSTEQALGLDISLIPQKELHELIPGLSSRMIAGSYCPTDGHADPLRTIDAFVRSAQRLGARVKWQCPVERIITTKDSVAAVQTSGEQINCRQVVLAAGYWSRALAESVGLDLPLTPYTLQMMVTARRSHKLGQVLGWLGHGISLKQVPSGGFVIGGGWPGYGDPEAYRTHLLPGSMAKSAKTMVDLYPALAGIPVVRSWVGIEAFCKDEMQIIGPVPKVKGLVLATGFSGHGFGIGPGVGALIAQYLTTGTMPAKLKPFGYERFNKDVGEKGKKK
ncbi:MAG: FAD-binding oxidoreductase [Deltaproteobacteria bacterium]|nr:FAD-binding oxidoreductase [Deltaproteobacteria bacterium]